MEISNRNYLYLFYLLLSGYYLLAFPHQLSTSDAVYYLMTSRELASGMIWEGINSYWSVLISVLMVPLMWIGLKGLWVFKVIQLLLGLAAIHLVWKMANQFRLKGRYAFWALMTCVFLIWMMSMSHTPDLLMVVLLIAYFLEIKDLSNNGGKSSAWKIGVIGGLLFLCKGYGLPFFLGHFTFWFIFQKLKERKVRDHIIPGLVNKRFFTGMLAFIIITGSWIGIISWKYGHFTTGSSGSYNMAYMGPKMQFYPPYFDRLQNPETEFTTFFIGEEQGLFAAYGKWDPFGSKAEFNYFVNRLIINIWKLYYITYLRDLVCLLAIVTFLFLIYKIRLSSEDQQLLWVVLLFLGVYNAGYFFLFPNERYIWINHIILTLIFFKMLSYLWETIATTKITWVLLAVSILIFGINIEDRVYARTFENSFYNAFYEAKNDIARLELTDKEIVGSILPTPNSLIEYNNPVCLLMYEYHFRVWGFIQNKKLNASIISEMAEIGIDYFFLWGNQADTEGFTGYPLLYANAEIELRIFDLQKSR